PHIFFVLRAHIPFLEPLHPAVRSLLSKGNNPMASAHWFGKLFRRTPQASAERRSPGQAGHRGRAAKLCLELLEERTLLTAPAPFNHVFTGNGSQLGDSSLVSTTYGSFLGASFSGGASVGGIEHTFVGDFGAEGHLNISGTAGLDWDTYLTSG